MVSHSHLAHSALLFLQHPAFAELEQSGPHLEINSANLGLPTLSVTLSSTLQALGCSEDASRALEQVFRQSDEDLARETRQTFVQTLTDLKRYFGEGEKHVWMEWQDSVGRAMRRKYEVEVEAVKDRIVQEVRAAKSRYSASSSTCSPTTPSILSHPLLHSQASTEASGNFTEEVVGILHKAFETKATLTRAEVKSLSAVTQLNTKQIRTWFANQRQRRGGRKGAAPYNLAITRPSNQRNLPSTPRRNVSNSSSNSSLLSYADSSVSISPPHSHQQDVFSSPIEYTPSPPQHQEVQTFPSYAPTHSQEFDVPMMHYTEPTPITTQFSRPPPLPLSTPHFPLPSPPTTAQTDSFFSLPLPPSHTPSLSYSPTHSSPFPSPPQQHSTTQHELSFLDQLQSTDPFLDDQFLENVFGNLGVTANGGLTLMMDSFEDEGGLKGGNEGGGFSFGW